MRTIFDPASWAKPEFFIRGRTGFPRVQPVFLGEQGFPEDS
jgi:hypothetical protein